MMTETIPIHLGNVDPDKIAIPVVSVSKARPYIIAISLI